MPFFRASLCVLAILLFSLTATAQSDLSVTKTSSDRAIADTDVTFNIQVVNTGPNAAPSVTLTDPIPDGLTFVSISVASGAGIFSPCTTPQVGSAGTITCTAAPFAAGAVVNFTLVLHVPSSTPPGTVFTNVATIGITPGFEGFDPNDENNSSAAVITGQESDLGVVKTGPDSAAADSDVSFNIQAVNGGLEDAASVTLTDVIPAGLTFVSLNVTTGAGIFSPCTTPTVGSGGTITCTAASFPAGATVNFTLVLHVPAETPPGTSFTNVANISLSEGGFDPNEENNSSSAGFTTSGAPMADLLANKSGPASAAPDTDVSFVIMIQNTGPTAATGVSFSDTLPGTLTFVSMTQNNGQAFICTTPAVGAGGTVTCTLASMDANTSASFTLVAHIPPNSSGTEYQNSVTVTATSPDPNSENNTGTTFLRVAASDINILKAGPATATAGDNISWIVTIGNGGPDIALNATFNDQLPGGTTFVSLVQNTGPAASSCTTPAMGENGLVNCSFAELAPDTTAQFTLTAKIGNVVSITNTATALSDSADTNSENNSASVTTTVTSSSDLSITKTDSPDPVLAGSNINYALTISNAGVSDAQTVSFTDAVPANTTFVSVNQTSGPAFTCSTPPVGGTGNVTCSIATLPAGASAMFDLVVRVSSNATTGSTVTNSATVMSTTGDPNTENNTAQTTTSVIGVPDLTISKTHSGNFTAGQPGSYTITVSNIGGGATTGVVTVTDTVPIGLTPTGPTGLHNGWNCSINGQTLTCARVDELPAGSSYPVITLTVQVINPAPLSVTNTATVSGGGDVNPTNNSASDPTTINCVPDASQTNTNPLMISRFRQNGPNGPTDEFVEIYNPGTTAHVVASGNCTGGYSVVASAGNGTTSNAVLQVCRIPNGTVIPAGGYYLCTGSAYSLNNRGLNGGPEGATAIGDAPIGCGGSCIGDIPNDAGLALLDVGANVVSLCGKGSFACASGFIYSSQVENGSARLYDSVGFNSYGLGAPAPGRPSLAGNFCEGPCLQPVGDASTGACNPSELFPVVPVPPACYGLAGQYQILRRQTTFDASLGTVHQDTNNNPNDFILVAPTAVSNMGILVTGVSGVTAVLGAAGPQNSTAPADMPRTQFTQAPFDGDNQLGAPNAERIYALDPSIANTANDPLGTFILRLRFTNNSGKPITPIRFRIDNLATLCGPHQSALVGTANAKNLSTTPDCGGAGFSAILKVVNSAHELVMDSSGTMRTVLGTIMEDLSAGAPPAPGPLSPFGGGIDNTLITARPEEGSTGDGVNGGRGFFNGISFASPPANVFRVRFKFGVVKTGRFILLVTPQAKFGPTPLEGIRSEEKAGQ
ncbi:MAG TPA: hypothetical protein VEW46_10085 [Pyrinomonadaceae bacterium]|nr:hypothetical protein [Pyrinomonadaceae bacterium]